MAERCRKSRKSILSGHNDLYHFIYWSDHCLFPLKDPHNFYQSVLGIVPPKFRTDFRTLTKIANQQLGAFLKGQIIASFILGAVYWVTFLLIGLEFVSILAIAAGLLCIIPYIGPFIAFFPGLFIAFQDSTFMAVKFVDRLVVVQLLHGDLGVPRVMGDRLQIHPITILIVLLVMGDLLGIMGVIFGIPIYTLIKLLVVFSLENLNSVTISIMGIKEFIKKLIFQRRITLSIKKR